MPRPTLNDLLRFESKFNRPNGMIRTVTEPDPYYYGFERDDFGNITEVTCQNLADNIVKLNPSCINIYCDNRYNYICNHLGNTAQLFDDHKLEKIITTAMSKARVDTATPPKPFISRTATNTEFRYPIGWQATTIVADELGKALIKALPFANVEQKERCLNKCILERYDIQFTSLMTVCGYTCWEFIVIF